MRRLTVVGAVLTGGIALSGAGTMPDGRRTPTGLEVPRWVSLKSSEVRARSGPGLDYRILWEYRAAGLPVQVVAETREWRKICDPQGSVAWIHRSVASGRRTLFNPQRTEVPIRTHPAADAGLRARLKPWSTIALTACEDGWCRVGGRKVNGWVQQSQMFGAQSRALCDARRPAGPAAPR